MSEISQEVVERMVSLVRKMEPEGSHSRSYTLRREDYVEAHAIAALLPEPVDPDLIEARRIALKNAKDRGYFHTPACYLAGDHDESDDVQIALAAIKRGRALERGK